KLNFKMTSKKTVGGVGAALIGAAALVAAACSALKGTERVGVFPAVMRGALARAAPCQRNRSKTKGLGGSDLGIARHIRTWSLSIASHDGCESGRRAHFNRNG